MLFPTSQSPCCTCQVEWRVCDSDAPGHVHGVVKREEEREEREGMCVCVSQRETETELNREIDRLMRRWREADSVVGHIHGGRVCDSYGAGHDHGGEAERATRWTDNQRMQKSLKHTHTHRGRERDRQTDIKVER